MPPLPPMTFPRTTWTQGIVVTSQDITRTNIQMMMYAARQGSLAVSRAAVATPHHASTLALEDYTLAVLDKVYELNRHARRVACATDKICSTIANWRRWIRDLIYFVMNLASQRSVPPIRDLIAGFNKANEESITTFVQNAMDHFWHGNDSEQCFDLDARRSSIIPKGYIERYFAMAADQAKNSKHLCYMFAFPGTDDDDDSGPELLGWLNTDGRPVSPPADWVAPPGFVPWKKEELAMWGEPREAWSPTDVVKARAMPSTSTAGSQEGARSTSGSSDTHASAATNSTRAGEESAGKDVEAVHTKGGLKGLLSRLKGQTRV